jgi:secretion/DNA translocation related CpaE-like protein
VGKLGQRAPIVAVLGGCGGAGATSLAAVLAARGGREDVWPVLIDLDPLGGGIDIALGAEDVPGARWSGLHATGGRLDPEQLAEGLPRWGDVPFLACDSAAPLSADAVASVLEAATAIGPVIVDVGRSDSPARARALAQAEQAVLLVPAFVRSISAAASTKAAVADFEGDWTLVVRSSRSSVVGPDWVAEVIGLELFGVLEPDRGLTAAADRGIDPGHLTKATARLARDLMDHAQDADPVPARRGRRRSPQRPFSLLQPTGRGSGR